jgi:hypothetical protein
LRSYFSERSIALHASTATTKGGRRPPGSQQHDRDTDVQHQQQLITQGDVTRAIAPASGLTSVGLLPGVASFGGGTATKGEQQWDSKLDGSIGISPSSRSVPWSSEWSLQPRSRNLAGGIRSPKLSVWQALLHQ